MGDATQAAATGWFRNLPIGRKLAAVVIAYVSIIAVLLLVVRASLDITSGVRAYVGGEGLWSKGQKDAVYYLTRYARSHDQHDYLKYREALAVPLGDGVARRELLKPAFDHDTAARGFIEGANDAADVDYMIDLFRRFRRVSYMAQAIDIWTRAEAGIIEMQTAGDELHGAVAAGTLTPDEETAIIGRIETINRRLTPLEHDFSATLGEAARWIRQVLQAVIVLASILLLVAGLAVSLRVTRMLRGDIEQLRRGAARVAAGDLSQPVPPGARDELGELAAAFNDMIEHRRGAEEALRSANDFRQKVMESATNAIYALDLQGRFTLINRRTCEITGRSEAELLGHHFGMLF
ncbi:MAG TPA: HAMP domain-containing protein, partial [Nevskiaceae bacterium]|nr:HAMP domain-containing protein [Nevskiaceae bacterium]